MQHLHGISTTKHLLDSGLSRHTINQRLARGELEHLQRRLYRHGVSPETEEQLAAAALLAMNGRGFVTGASALRLTGRRIRIRQRVIDITVRHGTAITPVAGVVFRRSSHLDNAPSMNAAGLAVLDAPWALGDLARDVNDVELAKVIAKGVGAGWWTLDEVGEGLNLRGRFPGRARLRRVLTAMRSDLPFSATEKRAARGLRRQGHPVVLQHRLVRPDGRPLALLDLAIVQLRLNLEVDGPHHWLPDQVAIDRRLDRQKAAIGWETARFSVYEIDNDLEGFIREAELIIERRVRPLAA